MDKKILEQGTLRAMSSFGKRESDSSKIGTTTINGNRIGDGFKIY